MPAVRCEGPSKQVNSPLFCSFPGGRRRAPAIGAGDSRDDRKAVVRSEWARRADELRRPKPAPRFRNVGGYARDPAIGRWSRAGAIRRLTTAPARCAEDWKRQQLTAAFAQPMRSRRFENAGQQGGRRLYVGRCARVLCRANAGDIDRCATRRPISNPLPMGRRGCVRRVGGRHRNAGKQHVDVVWTGPLVTPVSLRRSAAVLLELIQSAQREIVCISYAAFRIPYALRALEQRTRDGVMMHFILESEEDSRGRLRRDASAAFDPLMGSPTVTFYTWPVAKRPPGALLHAKAVIVDGHSALVTSANLTENAISSNIEIGFLIKGGDAPRRIHEHVKALMAAGEFVLQEI